MEITKDILYVGVNDHLVDLFEGQYDVPNGMAYNSYLICDDKVAVMDSVDAHFTDEWITKIAAALGERTPDYLVVQHMEPDHSGSVAAFAQAYPGTTIVASAQAFNMMKAYFGTDYADRRVVVKEGDTLPLGTHTLHFVTAPMVHWPEVIMTYDDADKVLFSADAFGKFGALDVEEPWLPEARRYFIGIVGKYGVQVQAVLKKAAALDIETVCSLHGPVLHKEQLGDVLAAYDTWSATAPRPRVCSSPTAASTATLPSCQPPGRGPCARRAWKRLPWIWPAAIWPRPSRRHSASASWYWPRLPTTPMYSPS